MITLDRVYSDYRTWEDYKAGMYNESRDGRIVRVNLAMECLSSNLLCLEYMNEVVKQWPVATEFNFTNEQQNRRAWLGQAACCLYGGCHEDETREAWGKITQFQRETANRIAEHVINEWLAYNEGQMKLL